MGNIFKDTQRSLQKGLVEGFAIKFAKHETLYINDTICQSLSGILRFTHYLQLFTVSDKNARDFYGKEAIDSGWSVR